MVEENISQELRLRKIEETRNYSLEEIKQNELISRKYKMVCTTLHYIGHLLLLASSITGYISVSALASLLVIPIGITNSALGIKILQ